MKINQQQRDAQVILLVLNLSEQ